MSISVLRAQTIPYSAPVDSPLYLSGNFCQLREGHFHFGLDIPTNDTIWPIYAVSDGYISRVFSADYGYGNALFVTHRDKNVSVYAHLSKFKPDIESWMLERVYKLQRNNVDLFPKANQFPVKRGMLIGWSGSSGASTGPHLHLEIRNPANELLNPVRYFNIPDTMPPDIDEVIFRTAEGHIISALNDTFYLDNRTAFISACIYDRAIFPENKLAPYDIKVYNNLGDLFQISFRKFSFAQNPSVVRHTNRTLSKLYQKKFHRLWVEANNKAPFYSGYGITQFPEGISELYIKVTDYSGKTALKKYIIKVVPKPSVSLTGNYYPSFPLIYFNTDSSLVINVFPKYNRDSLGVIWSVSGDSVKLTQGGILSVDDFIPEVILSIRIPDSLMNLPEQKRYIGFKASDSEILYCGGRQHAFKPFIEASIRVQGKYGIYIDTIPPALKTSHTDEKGIIHLTIGEQGSGLLYYKAKLDGRWIRSLRNPITGEILINPSELAINKPGLLEIFLSDKCGNAKTWSIILSEH